MKIRASFLGKGCLCPDGGSLIPTEYRTVSWSSGYRSTRKNCLQMSNMCEEGHRLGKGGKHFRISNLCFSIIYADCVFVWICTHSAGNNNKRLSILYMFILLCNNDKELKSNISNAILSFGNKNAFCYICLPVFLSMCTYVFSQIAIIQSFLPHTLCFMALLCFVFCHLDAA